MLMVCCIQLCFVDRVGKAVDKDRGKDKCHGSVVKQGRGEYCSKDGKYVVYGNICYDLGISLSGCVNKLAVLLKNKASGFFSSVYV